MLVAAAVSVAILATRPDFEEWYLLPSFGLWGGGHVVIVKLGRRKESPRIAALKEELEMDRMKSEHKRRQRFSWAEMHSGAIVGGGLLGFLTLVLGGLWLSTYGIEGILEWLSLLGCRCQIGS